MAIYQTGFGSYFSSEAVPGALPVAVSCPATVIEPPVTLAFG